MFPAMPLFLPAWMLSSIGFQTRISGLKTWCHMTNGSKISRSQQEGA